MSGAATPAGGGVQIEHKKGEVNELKTSLRNPSLDRDPEKKREVIKRVIAYMTLGIDVSKLFSEMIMVRALPMLRLRSRRRRPWSVRQDLGRAAARPVRTREMRA